MASIAIADVINHAPLPIDAQDVASKINLVVAGNRAGWEAGQAYARIATGAATEPLTLRPEPVVYSHEDALHAELACSRSPDLPSGFDPFLEPTDDTVGEPLTVTGITNAGSPSAIRDGDPATYAVSTLGGTSQIIWREWLTAGAKIVGFKLVYTLVINAGARSTYAVGTAPGLVTLTQHTARSVSDPVEARYVWAVQESNDHNSPYDLYAVAPFDARGHADNNEGETVAHYSYLTFTVLQQAVGGELRIHAFYPLILNETLLLDIAKANIKLPASAPQRVTVRGYVAPEAEHTIVGWPGGDYTGTVAQHQYETDRTIIDFEQAGSPVGMPAEAIEAARAQRVATQSVVDTAGYGLKMGERQ